MKLDAERIAHGVDHVLVPEKAVPAARAEIADAEIGNAAQAFYLFPEARFGAGVENVEFEFGQMLEGGARLQFADLGQRIDLPH